MKRYDTIIVMIVMALFSSVGIITLIGGLTGIAVLAFDKLAVSGMIFGLSGVIFGIISIRYFWR